jgi:hypothetical protein
MRRLERLETASAPAQIRECHLLFEGSPDYEQKRAELEASGAMERDDVSVIEFVSADEASSAFC